jgi:hypothetical protein
MIFRTWFDYSMMDRCSACKQIMKKVYHGLIPATYYEHYKVCPMREYGRIESCPHCGKDLDGL